MCVHSRATRQGRVLQERHQLNRTSTISLSRCRVGLLLAALCFTETTQPGSQRSSRFRPAGLLLLRPLWVVDYAVALEALSHGEGFAAARVGAGEGPLLLVEGVDVALQVEERGEGPVAAVPGAPEDHSCVRVDGLVLLQEPHVFEDLAALVTPQADPVLLLPVLQELSPGLPCEAAALLFAGVSSVHLFMPLQPAGEGEPHLAAFIRALVGGQLRVLLTHVGFQLLVLLELHPAAVLLTHVHPSLLAVDAAHVSGQVAVGGEGLRAAVRGAAERLHPAVGERVSAQVVRAAEGLPAAVLLALVRLHPRVFTQVGVQLPLLVISRLAAGKRADVPFVRLHFN